MPLIVCKIPDMTWRDTVGSYGGRFNKRFEVLRTYDECISDGLPPETAAFIALGEYDCLDFTEELKQGDE